MKEGKKIVMWCGDAPNQRALVNKIAQRFDLRGIVIDKKKNLKKPPLWKRIPVALQDRVFFRKINGAWTFLQHEYEKQFPQWPPVTNMIVDSINSDEAFDFTRQLAPDLILVSGTSLVKKKMLSLDPSIGIINLHTGLSPYIKGGPNCTNWCIANNEWGLIGNTIMWINSGIDSGNIITTKKVEVNSCDDLFDIHKKVMEEAHQLYIDAIRY